MKYLSLLLLVFSPVAFGEISNLNCSYISTLKMEDLSVSGASGTETFSVDTEKKEVTMQGGSFRYTENGNKIMWTALEIIEIGDDSAFGRHYVLDRVSGELEIMFATKYFEKGYSNKDFKNYFDFWGYDIGLVHSLQCKKVQRIF
tara:strand:+ start:654 stop:1088 length:435 start_codon:yes stop_codon:yes gene_type:complete